MQFAACSEILDRDQLGAVELAQEQNAGVERLVDEPVPLESRQHHGACATIPLGAAFLRSLRSHFLPQPVEDGCARGELAELNLPAPETKAQHVSRDDWSGLKRHCRSLTPAMMELLPSKRK